MRCDAMLSMMVMASPPTIADMKNHSGMYSEYHSGCSFSGISRKIDPRADWCSMERHTPKIVAAESGLHEDLPELLHVEPLPDGRTPFHELAGQVQSHVPGHQEQHRIDAPGDHHGIRYPIVPAQVEGQSDDGEQITEKPGQHRGPEQEIRILSSPRDERQSL